MTTVWLRATAELRRRWPTTLLLVLLIALAGGTVMAATAGARRTASAYPRMLEEANAGDVLVNPNDGDTDFDTIEALPDVVDAARGYGHFVTRIGPQGEPDFSVPFIAVASDGRLGYEIERPVNLQGRLPDPERADEVVLSRPLAEDLGSGVGSELGVYVFPDEQSAPESMTIRVVGVGLFPQDALQDTENEEVFPFLLLSPAFHAAHPDGINFTASVVTLGPGGRLDRFLADAQRVAGEKLFLQTSQETTAKAERALRPYAAALAAFAAVTAFVAMLVLGQAIARQLLSDAGDAPTLSAIGVTRAQLAASIVLRGAAMGVAGAVLAVALAIAVSPLLPIGPARAIDPDPGLAVDGAVIASGAVAVALLATSWGVAVAWRVARAPLRTPASALGRRSRLAALLSGMGMPPTSSVGVRMALEPGRGVSAVPARTTIVGAVLGLAALVAALTFGAGLDRLLGTPRLYGWDWDALVSETNPEVVDLHAASRLEELPSVEAVTAGSYGQLIVDGLSVATVGLGQDGKVAVHPPLLEGRPAAGPDEIVLGSTTLRRIGRDVGDTVEVAVGSDAHQAHVVGRAVFPRLNAYPGAEKTGMGDGASMTVEALADLIPDNELGFYLVDFAEGVEQEAALAEVRRSFVAPPEEDDPVVERPQRPDDLVGYERVNDTPVALAALLAVLAGATTAHGLVVTTRRRRRDLALLKTLGFTPRQVSVTVAWQATVVAAVALAVGLPLGVASGRLAWSAMAERLGTAAEPVTPVRAVILAIPIALVLANAVAWLPGRAAARTHPAVALRSE